GTAIQQRVGAEPKRERWDGAGGKRKDQGSDADGERKSSTHQIPPQDRECAMAWRRRRFPWRRPSLRVAGRVRRWYAFVSHVFFCVPPPRAAAANRPAVGDAAPCARRGGTGRLARGVRRAVAPPRRERRRKEAGADPEA